MEIKCKIQCRSKGLVYKNILGFSYANELFPLSILVLEEFAPLKNFTELSQKTTSCISNCFYCTQCFGNRFHAIAALV